ncbi:MAG: phosphoglycolate phosphatase [Desulfurococcales archaeon]|nr:phosphoglycolate phosphatase [Desulfurococcales archaeon]
MPGPIKAVLVDVDGTLTEARGSKLISLDAVAGVRLLERRGVVVVLVSGNSLPVTAGLAYYLGSSGPVIGENGCVALYQGRVIHFCEGRPPESLIKKIESLGFVESWQNQYRHHDLALLPRRGEKVDRRVLAEASRIVIESGYKPQWSGYALHILPPHGGKSLGARKVAKLLGVGLSELGGVGDGENDIEMLEVVGFSAAPSDADERVKEVVDYVASKPGGAGFREIALKLLGLQAQ